MAMLLNGDFESFSLVGFAQAAFEFGASDRRLLPPGRDQPPEIVAHAERDLFVVEARDASDHRDGAAISGEQYAVALCLSHT